MLGIEDYGSDVESGDETTTATAPSSSLPSKHLPPTPKPTLALPPPKSSLPPPLTSTSAPSSKPKRTKKITINLPSLPPSEDDEDGGPPAKKSRVAPSTGAGKSSLLSMLPAPKRPVPIIEKKVEGERVLGGGGGPGLVFRAPKRDNSDPTVSVDADAETKGPASDSTPSTSFLPPSLKKGRANVSLETDDRPFQPQPSAPLSVSAAAAAAPSVDFFSLGSSTKPAGSAPAPPTSSAPPVTDAPSTPGAPSLAVSSAPAISTFRPPSPTLDDPHPGYYQLPSGAYVPYEAAYYASYARTWQAEYDRHIRALEKAQYEPETDDAQDVDMAAEMEKARREVKEREDRKALTLGKAGLDENGEPAMPKMNVKGAKLGAVARSRHQLTTLLTEAYLNREALEDKIAQGRRNRKEAGNKYGF